MTLTWIREVSHVGTTAPSQNFTNMFARQACLSPTKLKEIHITSWHPKIRDGWFHIWKVDEIPYMMGNFKVGSLSTWYWVWRDAYMQTLHLYACWCFLDEAGMIGDQRWCSIMVLGQTGSKCNGVSRGSSWDGSCGRTRCSGHVASSLNIPSSSQVETRAISGMPESAQVNPKLQPNKGSQCEMSFI